MQLWGGRFKKETAEIVRQLNDSISYDQRFFSEDIDGSIAWARGLVGAGILTPAECTTIVNGLEDVRAEWISQRFEIKEGDEDIHTANERRLTELIGEVGGKLHTGRSRNDQVATDFRLWVMGACDRFASSLTTLQKAMIAHAETAVDVPLPGYTHLQHAQPVTWAHWILSHTWPLVRDITRFGQARVMADVCPLGSAALAGTAFPVDREVIAAELGFSTISQNSLDAVSDRDFVADFLYAGSLTALHLSRLSEQLMIFNSPEFGFITLDDAYSTGSSLMPQKKNPDTLELTRGKAGRLVGRMTGFLTTIKGLPSSYDKDLQEDKEAVFEVHDTLLALIQVMTGLIETLSIRPEKMAAQLEPTLLATDLADYLVKKGMPFREAHHVVGRVVQIADIAGKPLTELSLTELQAIDGMFAADVVEALTIEGSLHARNVIGGTGKEAVLKQIEALKRGAF